MSEFTVKYCIEDRGTRLPVTSGNDKDVHKEPQFTLLVRQSCDLVSRYFCSHKVCDARFSRLEEKELFFISLSSFIILDQQERYLPLKVPHVCVCVYIYIYMYTHTCK